jgi:hypothetical protein
LLRFARNDNLIELGATIDLAIPSPSISTIARSVTVMAFEAGGAGKAFGVAISAVCAFVVNAISFTASGMSQVEAGIVPIRSIVALAT